MCYDGDVVNPFVVGLASNFEQALRLMEAALADCPDELWATDLWPDEAPTAPTPHGGLHGSAPWFLGYHARNTLDYDLAAELEPWQPPRPFDDNTWSSPNRVFTKPELLGYVTHCRHRARRDARRAHRGQGRRAPPGAHRHHPMTYGVLVGGLPLHVVEHAAQIRQFLTAAGVRVRRCPAIAGTWLSPALPASAVVGSDRRRRR